MAGCAAVAAALLLAGCGKDDETARAPIIEVKAGDQVIQMAQGSEVRPITHDFPKAGRYTLTMTGQLQVSSFTDPADALVSFDYSGGGFVTAGAAQQTYHITANGQTIPINQTVTIDVSGTGPWQMRTHIQTFGAGATLSGIQLKIAS